MKGLILLADHFEDVEALITIDMLRRAKIDVDLVSISKNINLVTQSKVNIQADYLVENINVDDYQFLIIPGGKAVFETHLSSNVTLSIVDSFYQKGKLIATICAAPIILGKLGILDNQNYVCFPDCKNNIEKGIFQNKKVVVQKNIITSKAAGTTFDFAFEIIKYLTNETLAKKVLESVYYF